MTFISKYRTFYIIILLSIPVGLYLCYVNENWLWFILSFLYVKILNFFSLQIGLHRYFSHRSFKTTRLTHNLLAYSSILTGQGTPISWATHHIHHHRFSDTNLDLHTPQQGFWNTCLLWTMRSYKYFNSEKKITPAPKYLVKDTTVMFIHKNYFLIWTLLIVLSMILDWRFGLYFVLMPAGMSVLHGNIVTNYLSHIKLPGSYRNFETSDNSWNNKYIQMFQGGEGLHNNHHYNMSNYNQAMKSGEFDLAAWVIDKFLKVN
jgi:stearoyl-CoA desaturase (delta-9 desaturase)